MFDKKMALHGVKEGHVFTMAQKILPARLMAINK